MVGVDGKWQTSVGTKTFSLFCRTKATVKRRLLRNNLKLLSLSLVNQASLHSLLSLRLIRPRQPRQREQLSPSRCRGIRPSLLTHSLLSLQRSQNDRLRVVSKSDLKRKATLLKERRQAPSTRVSASKPQVMIVTTAQGKASEVPIKEATLGLIGVSLGQRAQKRPTERRSRGNKQLRLERKRRRPNKSQSQSSRRSLRLST
jgi:hypothetical protein